MAMLEDILKNLSVAGTGLATGAAGTPASLVSLMASGGKKLGKFIDPENESAQNILDYIKSGAEYATPEALQSYAEKATGGYVKPETETQKVVGEVAQDIGSFVGVGGPVKGAVKLAALGNTAKQAIKFAGGTDEQANTAKLVGMMTSPLFKFNKIDSLYGTLYNDARSALKKPGTKGILQSKSIRVGAKKSYLKALKGTGRGVEKTPTRELVKGGLSKLKETYVPVDEVWEMSKDVNQEIHKMGKYIDKKKYALKPFRDSINSALELYGKRNKDFGYAFKNAQTLFGVQEGLPLLDKAINKTVGLKNTGLSEYFRKSMVWGFGGLKGLFAKKYLGSLSKRSEAFVRSPAYRSASMQLAKATMKNSLPMTVSAVRKLKSVYDDVDKGLTNKGGERFEFVTDKNTSLPRQTTKKTEFEVVSPEELKKLMKR